MSPFLAWGDFHARSRFARSIILEEKWGTTRSLRLHGRLQEVRLRSNSTMWSEYSLLVLLVIGLVVYLLGVDIHESAMEAFLALI